MHEPQHPCCGPTVHRPLDKLECAVCHTGNTPQKKVRVCEACGETAYCSEECQNKDWKKHKRHCGKDMTDRVQLVSFYPLLAVIAYSAHLLRVDNRDHPATCHQIINNPDPTTGEIVMAPNGEAARIVVLGDRIPPTQVGREKWWPSAASDDVRQKLLRRITCEGLLLPLMLAITVSLVREMYTSTALPSSDPHCHQPTGQRRVRLTYKKSPIADFGIVSGSAEVVQARHRLMYYTPSTGNFMMGQDPKDHYWLYFTTLSGEEAYLDCGMYTFNMGRMVYSAPYVRHGLPYIDSTPAVWQDKELDKLLPIVAFDQFAKVPRKRFSILRDTRLDDVICSTTLTDNNLRVLNSIMDEIADRPCTEWEKMMLPVFLGHSSRILYHTMKNRDYLTYPEKPKVWFDVDPGEIDLDKEQFQEQVELNAKYLAKLARRLKHGRITVDQWVEAYRKWCDTPIEARKKEGK